MRLQSSLFSLSPAETAAAAAGEETAAAGIKRSSAVSKWIWLGVADPGAVERLTVACAFYEPNPFSSQQKSTVKIIWEFRFPFEN